MWKACQCELERGPANLSLLAVWLSGSHTYKMILSAIFYFHPPSQLKSIIVCRHEILCHDLLQKQQTETLNKRQTIKLDRQQP